MQPLHFEPKGADGIASVLTPSGSVFLVGHCFSRHVAFGKHLRLPLVLRPSRPRRDQKTFSAGPRSFKPGELWFSARLTAAGVQPFSDSRHGRIVCKVCFNCTADHGRVAAPNQTTGFSAHTLSWLAAPLPKLLTWSHVARCAFHSCRRWFLRVLVTRPIVGRAAVANHISELWVQPQFRLAAAPQNHFFFALNPGNIRLAS